MKQRAIQESDKLLRRAAILAAARQVFEADGGRQLPSVNRIAEAANLAKGTVYLYFKTKEEIFLAQLAEYFQQLFAGLHDALCDDIPPYELARRFSDAYVSFLQNTPTFLKLAIQANTVLEQNLSAEVAVDFKSQMVEGLNSAGQLLEQRFPTLRAGQGCRLLMETYALTIGLYQMTHWPEALVKQLGNDPKYLTIRPPYYEALPNALVTLWTGALAQDPSKHP